MCRRAGWRLDEFAAACLDGGARLLQIRAKHATGAWLLDVTETIVAEAEAVEAAVIVNDRADVAMLGRASGVHVGQEDLSPAAVRRVVGRDAIVGMSTHTPDQLAEAMRQPIDYAAIGPIFGTVTKDTGYEPLGLIGVRARAGQVGADGTPLVAIGGITLATAADVLAAGATSVAVITDILATGDPASRVRDYLTALSRRA